MAYVDATFDGVHADASAGAAQFALGIGPEPSTGSVCLAGTGHAMRSGDLVFTDGTRTVTLAGLYVVDRQEHDGPDGRFTRLTLKDRRYKWACEAHVTGEWNKAQADGYTIAAALKKSARELAALCLDAMGESGYDVSALPNDFWPHVKWEFESAVRAAQAVCDLCRCTLSMDDADNAEVVALGSGAAPPATEREMEDEGVRYTDKPDKYVIRGARKMIQRTSQIFAVGLDTNGTVAGLENLTYAETVLDYYKDSWADAIRSGFMAMWDSHREAWRCARRSVGLWFRLPAAELDYLPILASVCEVKTEDAEEKWRAPYVTSDAMWHQKADGVRIELGQGEVGLPWTLDHETGVVKFTRHVIWADATSDDFATLKLVWACESNQDDGTLVDDDYYTYTAGGGSAEHVEPAEWLVLRGVIPDGGGPVVWQNQTELDAIAAKLKALIDEPDESVTSGRIRYEGVRELWPDGKMRQVSWNVGADGAGTEIVYNTDAPPIGRARLAIQIDGLKRRAESFAGAATAERASLSGKTRPPAAGASAGDSSLPEPPEGTCHAVNGAGDDIPDMGVVRLSEDGWDGTRQMLEAVKPAQAGIKSVGVARGVAPYSATDACVGSFYVTGAFRVLYLERAGWPTVAPKMRLGATKNSYYAQGQEFGPWRVNGVIQAPVGDAPGIAYVTKMQGIE